MIATSGRLRTGEPNLPPMAPMLLSVMVPSVISLVLSLLFDAISCNRDNSFVILCNHGNKFRQASTKTTISE